MVACSSCSEMVVYSKMWTNECSQTVHTESVCWQIPILCVFKSAYQRDWIHINANCVWTSFFYPFVFFFCCCSSLFLYLVPLLHHLYCYCFPSCTAKLCALPEWVALCNTNTKIVLMTWWIATNYIKKKFVYSLKDFVERETYCMFIFKTFFFFLWTVEPNDLNQRKTLNWLSTVES